MVRGTKNSRKPKERGGAPGELRNAGDRERSSCPRGTAAAGGRGLPLCNGSSDQENRIGGATAAVAPRSLPSDVLLDPTKRYYISVLPGDAINPTLLSATTPAAAGCTAANQTVKGAFYGVAGGAAGVGGAGGVQLGAGCRRSNGGGHSVTPLSMAVMLAT